MVNDAELPPFPQLGEHELGKTPDEPKCKQKSICSGLEK